MIDMATIIQGVLTNLYDHFAELDDSGEEAYFGEYARVDHTGNRLVVAHETDDDIQIEILVRAKGVDTPGTPGEFDGAIAYLKGFRDELPLDHAERPGVIRAIEVLHYS